MHWLVDGYGTDTRITNIVNSREIWIVFLVEPGRRRVRHLRRQVPLLAQEPPADARDLLHRDGSQPELRLSMGRRRSHEHEPAAITYRGTKAFSTPEARAVRDFLASRVVGGRQQIKVAISFHEAGRLVMWPYGYTMTDIPSDMTRSDHDALVHIGKQMAASNGYRPQQASDLYITSGTTRDFMYGMYRTFSYTFEMSVVDYPDDSKIASETGRNKNAILYLAERAGCPLSILGTTMRIARCGAFDDDLEVARGWASNPDGTDTATTGKFSRANPEGTSSSGTKQRTDVPSGTKALVTGRDRRRVGELERSRWPDLGPERVDPDVARTRPAAVLPVRVRPRVELVVGGQAGGQHRDRRAGGRPSSPSPAVPPTSTASGSPSPHRSTRGPGRRSGSTSWRSMARQTAWSRSRSTTCGSRGGRSSVVLGGSCHRVPRGLRRYGAAPNAPPPRDHPAPPADVGPPSPACPTRLRPIANTSRTIPRPMTAARSGRFAPVEAGGAAPRRRRGRSWPGPRVVGGSLALGPTRVRRRGRIGCLTAL